MESASELWLTTKRMELCTDSERTRRSLLLEVTDVLTSRVLRHTLAREMVREWLHELDYPYKIWNSFNSTLLVSTVLDV